MMLPRYIKQKFAQKWASRNDVSDRIWRADNSLHTVKQDASQDVTLLRYGK